jgi:hypothetical protein
MCFDQCCQIVNLILLGLTVFLLWKYTRETQRLRKATVDHNELVLKPCLFIETARNIINIGNGSAYNIEIEHLEFKLFRMEFKPINLLRAESAGRGDNQIRIKPIIIKSEGSPIFIFGEHNNIILVDVDKVDKFKFSENRSANIFHPNNEKKERKKRISKEFPYFHQGYLDVEEYTLKINYLNIQGLKYHSEIRVDCINENMELIKSGKAS